MSDYFHVCKTVCIKVKGMFGLDFIRNIHMYVQGILYQPGTGQIACLISLSKVFLMIGQKGGNSMSTKSKMAPVITKYLTE